MRETGQFRLAVGFFDGVHLGHRQILRGASAALTFENHPLSVLAPERAPRLIMSWNARAKAIMALGVRVTALEFDADLAARPPEAFLAQMIGLAEGAPLVVRCGANWRFGRGGAGDAGWLRARGVSVEIVPYVDYEGAPVSSSRIRAALSRGEIEAANAMLGRPYAVSGEVVKGKGLGAEIGYPTLNVVPELPDAKDGRLPIPFGVYAADVGGVKAVANYGFAPTMGARAWKSPVLEVHLLTSAGTRIPNPHTDPVIFRRFIRPERTFSTLEELRTQLAADVRSADG